MDFYSGIIYQAMRFPPDMFTVLTLGRAPGWLAQWSEMITDSDQKIARRARSPGHRRAQLRAGGRAQLSTLSDAARKTGGGLHDRRPFCLNCLRRCHWAGCAIRPAPPFDVPVAPVGIRSAASITT